MDLLVGTLDDEQEANLDREGQQVTAAFLAPSFSRWMPLLLSLESKNNQKTHK